MQRGRCFIEPGKHLNRTKGCDRIFDFVLLESLIYVHLIESGEMRELVSC